MLYGIVGAIRAALPGTALTVRIPGQDLLPGGLTLEAMREVARVLEPRGAVTMEPMRPSPATCHEARP